MANFLTIDAPLPTRGLDLFHSVDKVGPDFAARLTNTAFTQDLRMTSRAGMSLLRSCTGTPQTIGRYADSSGVEHDIYVNDSGDLYYDASLKASGFSLPVVATVFHSVASGSDPWLILTSADKVGKLRIEDGVYMPLGLVAPTSFTANLRGRYSVTLDTCDSATPWTASAGTGSGVPTITADTTDKQEGVASLRINTNNSASGSYYNFIGKSVTLDMTTFGGVDATDDDVIHFWVKTSNPNKVEEIRIYFVTSAVANNTTLPGTSTTTNTDAYYKAVRPSDYTSAIIAGGSVLSATDTAVTNLATVESLSTLTDTRDSVELLASQLEQGRWSPFELLLGSSWQELGAVGIPLYRGDFRRMGSDTTRSWANINAIIISIHINDNTDNIPVWLDDFTMVGGAGLDSAALGRAKYDYRMTNYDPRTGAESNPTAVQAESQWLDALRHSVDLTPSVAYGDSNVRQRFYRRGGTITDDWYFVGMNTSDGGTMVDGLTDLEIQNPLNAIDQDNNQPVTTVDADGNVISSANLKAIFGPIGGLMFGCGDDYRKGYLYWSKLSNPDAWPVANILDICPSSEELMNGAVLSGQAYVFSRERQYMLVANLLDSSQVTAMPTLVSHGLAARRGICVAFGRIWFVARDGLYATDGNEEVSVTANTLDPLFRGVPANGYYPIDWDHEEAVQLEAHGNEVFLTFLDTQGNWQTYIYHTLFKYWRHANFKPGVSTVFSPYGGSTVLLGATGTSYNPGGGPVTGNPGIYEHTGTYDPPHGDNWVLVGGTYYGKIQCRYTSASIDFGQPRQDKLYGDIVVDLQATEDFDVAALFGNESSTLSCGAASLTGLRARQYFDVQATQSQSMAIDLQWDSYAVPPVVYGFALSASMQVDTTVKRVTEWESGGRLSDKYVKGIIMEVDTGGQAKTIQILADGAVQTTLTVNATGRQVLQFSFNQFLARLLRLRPTDTNWWKLYSYNWIFDQEPLKLTRWESQELTHGVPGWHSLLYANITIRSTSAVTLEVTPYTQTGALASTTYSLSSTSGAKLKLFVPFQPMKGIMYKYLFTSGSEFWLYRPETDVLVLPWGGNPLLAKPFGDDDLDLTRSLNDAQFIADKSGWSMPGASGKAPTQTPTTTSGSE